uniref:RNA-directed DNA polymerase, eukaryota, reverse transcriptase zinc-binding domain protein n=1 Tax=Tanacetum cinerariifolium TaxID=118510 RepID=A0A6L2NW20_TANCI|nr:hypothetical protein [Tanacetum cinerariifolium]
MSSLSQNKDNYEDLDEIRVHNRDKQTVSDDLGVEKMWIHVDECDVDNNECLDPKKDECDVPSDDGLKSVHVLSNKECLDEEKLMDESPKLPDDLNKSYEKTYASATKNSSYFETNKLLFVHTEINEIGEEVVIFDEELVELKSKKWELTSCGHLISHCMSLPALNYHLRRMWYRTEFARVLVEVDADKGFKETVELQYKDEHNQVKGTKTVKVAYDWKPDICSHCVVFGHDHKNCKVKTRTEEEITKDKAESNMTTNKKNRFMQSKPSINGNKDWSYEMINYFKRSWKADREKEKDISLDKIEGVVEEVLEDEYEAIKNLVADEVNGVGCSALNQASFAWLLMDYKIEDEELVLDGIVTLFSFIYADNKGMDKRVLWNDLQLAKCSTIGCPWVIMGDFNVTLKLEEHSIGMFYTWIKSLSNPNTSILKKLDRIMKIVATTFEEFSEAIDDEKKLLFQEAKVELLSEGDSNTAYFHKVVKSKRNKNRITRINDNNGECLEGLKIIEEFVNHFDKFLGQSYPVSQLDTGGDIFLKTLTISKAEVMVSDVTNLEIKNAMFEIGDCKALGPNDLLLGIKCSKLFPLLGDFVRTYLVQDSCMDSHDHLFFQCQYANNGWDVVKDKGYLKNFKKEWVDTVGHMVVGHGRAIKSVVSRIVFGTVVYYIWQKRNKRCFT